jgi:two-component system, NarL family, response regulator NreC
MTATNATVLLVDDHAMMRAGLRRLLQEQEGIAVVGEADSGPSAFDQVRALGPQVVVMDVHLAAENGNATARRILAEFPNVRIVVLSADSSPPVITEALQAGVSAYVTKENDPAELVYAIQAVMDRRTYFCREASAVVMGDYMKTLAGKTFSSAKPVLTDRQRRLLELVAGGKRNKEIAEVLGMGVKAAETSRLRLMKKLGCTSVSELTRYAIREGLIVP